MADESRQENERTDSEQEAENQTAEGSSEDAPDSLSDEECQRAWDEHVAYIRELERENSQLRDGAAAGQGEPVAAVAIAAETVPVLGTDASGSAAEGAGSAELQADSAAIERKIEQPAPRPDHWLYYDLVKRWKRS